MSEGGFHEAADQCYVCMAGASLACRLRMPAGMNYVGTMMPRNVEEKCNALNAFRVAVWVGLQYWPSGSEYKRKRVATAMLRKYPIAPDSTIEYSEWKRWMRKAGRHLEQLWDEAHNA